MTASASKRQIQTRGPLEILFPLPLKYEYFAGYFETQSMLFSLASSNNEKEGAGAINDASVEREKTAFLTRANLGLGQEVN